MSEKRINWREIIPIIIIIILSMILIHMYTNNLDNSKGFSGSGQYIEIIDSLNNHILGLENRIEDEEYRIDSLRILLIKSKLSLDSIKNVYMKSREEIQNYKVEESVEFLDKYLKLNEL